MGRTVTISIAVIIAICLYLLIHHMIVSCNTKKAQSAALEQQTNVAVKAALQRLDR